MPSREELEAQIQALQRQLAEQSGVSATQSSAAIAGNNTDSPIAIGNQIALNLFTDAAFLQRVFGVPQPPAERREFVARYLQFLHDSHQYANFRGLGFADRVPLKLPLLDLYVSLKARVEMPRGETWARELQAGGRPIPQEDLAVLGERFSQPLPIADLLPRHSGLIILGDPGSGKTTFIKQLALRLATGQHTDKRFPVLLALSAYANAIAEKDIPLAEFIANNFAGQSGVDIRAELQHALNSGGALVMLDGLDEVKEVTRRRTVVDRVMAFFHRHRHNGNKFILTSRIVGYREVRPVAEGLEECTLADFDEEHDIPEFARRWTAALEKAAQGQTAVTARDAERQRVELLEAVHHNPGVRRLAANPLLLTILALMKREGITLPDRRAELYEKCVTVLVESWNRARSLDRGDGSDAALIQQTLKLLPPLALWMHAASDGAGLVKQQALSDKLAEMLLLAAIEPKRIEDATTRERDEAKACARAFLEDVRAHSGLLLERAPGQYGFIHLTFEEYLAGVGLARLGQLQIAKTVDAIRPHLAEAAWREVILLTVGHIGLVQKYDQVASTLVEALFDDSSQPRGTVWPLLAEAVRDVLPSGVTKACHERILARLTAAIAEDKQLPVQVRSDIATALGNLGDPRPGVGLAEDGRLPKLDWVELPKGEFIRGEDQQPAKIEKPYRISRYPITWQQYQAFWDDPEGYRQARFWADHWKGAPDAPGMREWWKQNKEEGPENYEAVFQTPNHPRVGVCWYEAVAFCRWLTERLRDGSLVVPALAGENATDTLKGGLRAAPVNDLVIRLPHENEWEWAARWNKDTGKADDRVYPWRGHDAAADLAARCNWYKTGLGHTSAVGLFPDGAADCGAMDLSGNVWEWCENWYDENSKQSRVLRGGSWDYGAPARLSSSCRNRDLSDIRYQHYGFRCVVVGVGAAPG